MQEATAFETKFSSLLQQKDKAPARAHLVGGKPEDLMGLSRVAKCRAVVLLDGKSDDVDVGAAAPRLLKLKKEKLDKNLLDLAEAAKTGSPPPAKARKAKGTLPAPGGKRPPGRPKGSKDKQPRKKRGLTPGGPPPGEEAEPEAEAEAQETQEEPEAAAEAPAEPETPETPVSPGVDQEALEKLLEGIDTRVDEKLQEVTGKVDEVVINTSALVKAIGEAGGQEKRAAEALEKFDELQKHIVTLYEQLGFLNESMSLAGALIMDCSPEEYRQTVIDTIEEQAKERRKRLPNATRKEDEAKAAEAEAAADAEKS
jgi:hypothetical protein